MRAHTRVLVEQTSRHIQGHKTTLVCAVTALSSHFCWFDLQTLSEPGHVVQVHITPPKPSGGNASLEQRGIWVSWHCLNEGFYKGGNSFSFSLFKCSAVTMVTLKAFEICLHDAIGEMTRHKNWCSCETGCSSRTENRRFVNSWCRGSQIQPTSSISNTSSAIKLAFPL